jgi:glycosyltransferase involved in cell wall biosynthesis
MSRPGISVIIPTLNRFSMLLEAVESCLSQTLPPSEIIISDNGSTDETVGFAWPTTVKLVQEQRPGAGAARKAGLRVAKEPLVFFLDSDDILVPEGLAILYDLLTNKDALLAHGSIANFREAKSPESRILQDPISAPLCSSSLIQQKAFETFGSFEDDNYSFPKWITRAIDSGLSAEATEATICHRRLHDSNVGRDPGSMAVYLDLARERIRNARG